MDIAVTESVTFKLPSHVVDLLLPSHVVNLLLPSHVVDLLLITLFVTGWDDLLFCFCTLRCLGSGLFSFMCATCLFLWQLLLDTVPQTVVIIRNA